MPIHDERLLAGRFVEELPRLFESVGAVLCLHDDARILQTAAASRGIAPRWAEEASAVGRAAVDVVAGRSTAVLVPDLLTTHRINLGAHMRLALEHAPFRALLAVPLVRNGDVIGVLSVLDRAGRIFGADDAEFARALGRLMVLALETARAYKQVDSERSTAVAASRAKDDFFATLSHELRNSLNAIFGWARILRTGRSDRGLLGRAVEAIERNAIVQSQLIYDMLDVTRIIAGKMSLNVRPTSLPSLVGEALDSLRPAAEAKFIRIEMTSAPDIGMALGDPLRLHQLMTNLVSNAIKFTPGRGRVLVRLERDGNEVRISVADTGKGIDGALLPHVFDRFWQKWDQDEEKERTSAGLGLGLTIVRHIAELHGGTVSVESPGLGLGATFIINLPLMRPDATYDSVPKPAASSLPAPAVALGGLRVLVVDDHDDSREVIAILLRRYGAEVLAVATGEEAMQLLRQSKIDAVVSDVAMPHVDGFDLIRTLRDHEREQGEAPVPAVALTGYSGAETRARSVGFQAHALKPIDPDRLALMIARLVGRPLSHDLIS